MKSKPFRAFTVMLVAFAAWCTLPVLGLGLGVVQDGQAAFEGWFLTIAELLGGATVLTFVLGAHSTTRKSSAVTPTETLEELEPATAERVRRPAPSTEPVGAE